MFARVLLLFELLLKEMLFLFHFVAGSSAFRVRSIENNERLSNLKSPSFNCLHTNFEPNYFEGTVDKFNLNKLGETNVKQFSLLMFCENNLFKISSAMTKSILFKGFLFFSRHLNQD